MFLHIDPDSGLAIYDQIVRQVKFAVAGGGLPPGELIPSVRELARELAVNPNTVARAFQQLQADGVLEPVRGQGLAVSRGADKRCRATRLQLIAERLREVLDEALRAGLDVAEIRRLTDEQVDALAQRRAQVLNVPALESRRETQQ
jgi:GntR family transcriptional regulator